MMLSCNNMLSLKGVKSPQCFSSSLSESAVVMKSTEHHHSVISSEGTRHSKKHWLNFSSIIGKKNLSILIFSKSRDIQTSLNPCIPNFGGGRGYRRRESPHASREAQELLLLFQCIPLHLGLIQKEIQLNLCNVFSIIIFNELHLFA